jgi:hypothetical protein
MSNANFKSLKKALAPEMVELEGTFLTTANNGQWNKLGQGMTVSGISTGTYKVTLNDGGMPGGWAAQANLNFTTGAPASTLAGAYVTQENAAAGTFQVRTWTTTQDNLANVTSGVVHVVVHGSNHNFSLGG